MAWCKSMMLNLLKQMICMFPLPVMVSGNIFAILNGGIKWILYLLFFFKFIFEFPLKERIRFYYDDLELFSPHLPQVFLIYIFDIESLYNISIKIDSQILNHPPTYNSVTTMENRISIAAERSILHSVKFLYIPISSAIMILITTVIVISTTSVFYKVR